MSRPPSTGAELVELEQRIEAWLDRQAQDNPVVAAVVISVVGAVFHFVLKTDDHKRH